MNIVTALRFVSEKIKDSKEENAKRFVKSAIGFQKSCGGGLTVFKALLVTLSEGLEIANKVLKDPALSSKVQDIVAHMIQDFANRLNDLGNLLELSQKDEDIKASMNAVVREWEIVGKKIAEVRKENREKEEAEEAGYQAEREARRAAEEAEAAAEEAEENEARERRNKIRKEQEMRNAAKTKNIFKF